MNIRADSVPQVMEVEEGESKEEFEQAIRQVLQDSIELLKAALPFAEIEPCELMEPRLSDAT